MFGQSLLRCGLGLMLLCNLLACEDQGADAVIGLNSERGVAPASGRDSGVISNAVPFIDTGVGSAGSDFAPGAACQGNQRAACATQCGVQRCVGGQWTECGPVPETCNGSDDDCDGSADEDLGIGSVCSNRQDNGCVAAGVLSCNFDTGELDCESMPMEPGAELCDGIDNDCDGQSDEDYPEQRCCTENYHCSPGAVCTAGQCVGQPSTGESGPRGAGLGEACGNPFDCQFGLSCAGGTCEPVCFGQADCEGGLTCSCHVDNQNCFLTTCLDASVAAPPRQSQPPAPSAENNQPGNGEGGVGSLSCEQLTQLNGFGQYFNTTDGAVDELDTTCGGRQGGLERVFAFLLPEAQDVLLDTTGSSFDTVMAVRTECNEIGTEMLCDDDGAGQLRSRLQFRAEANRRYFVIVQGYSPNVGGDITLSFGVPEGR